MIEIRSKEEIEKLRQAGKVLAEIVAKLKPSIKAGIATQEIDRIAEELIKKSKAIAAFKGYRGFPANICISINEEIVHGIPSERVIRDGDLVGLDIGINLNGFFSDTAFTAAIGKISSQEKKLIDTARKSLEAGISKVKVNNRLGDVSAAIQQVVEAQGFSVVRDFVGHGIGKKMHEDPEIPNFGQAHQGPILKEGMVLAIEPMVNMGTWEAEILPNGWTAVTKDKKPSVHFEHTVALTDKGPEVLTK
ncbi:MAG: type I methionyl aminopeptidase [Candidatus Omnitrophota bacterium]|nr:type I methionyl aminopeptidase [Candidatus Omnitrophota bacterium]